MAVLKKIKSHPDVVDYFKELPYYNNYLKKLKVKRLKTIDFLSELPFYEELNVIKTNHAFRGYAMSYKVEIIEKKDPIKQLEASKSSIKDLFSDLLNETKGFKYQITLKVVLKKYKPNGEIEFRPVYFNSKTKTVINHKFSLENAFQEILYRIDDWINEGSGWIVELIESQHIGVFRHINPVKIYPERITKKDKQLVNDLDYDWLNFLCEKKILVRLKKRTTFASMCFVTKTS